MCGIIAYCGHRPATPVILEGLKRLEYRGYDSAGLAVPQGGALRVVRKPGKLAELEAAMAQATNLLNATHGMGHTRWATHGEPTENNAHPHQSSDGRLALVHNGIIENYQEIKNELLDKGYTFSSDTDSEVLANLISEGCKQHASVPQAISWALARAEGAYAIAVLHKDHPGQIWGARQTSPLVMGLGVGENFLASDIPAFLPYTREVIFLSDGELVQMDAGSFRVMDAKTLAVVDKEPQTITWDVQSAQKGGYKHFMLKEIFEQPRVVRDCLLGRMDHADLAVTMPELEDMPIPERLHIVACGTSYHAGLWGQQIIESLARVPVSVEIASEFRYRDMLLGQNDLVLSISQSGETIDTLAGLRLAKECGVPVMGLCNVVGSTIARESDFVTYTQAGPEISVASTKAMCSQLTLLTLLALYWAERKGVLSDTVRREAIQGLHALPEVLQASLPTMRDTARELARSYSEARSFLYLGRGLNHPLALEGALKLKEISYIHAEGYPAGEMKHGPIALIDPKFPTFAIALDDALYPKVKSNLAEIQARGGKIIALTNPGLDLAVDHPWVLPKVWGPLGAFLVLPALQLFAYEMADYLGKDVDQPRNLAKSVTVE